MELYNVERTAARLAEKKKKNVNRGENQQGEVDRGAD